MKITENIHKQNTQEINKQIKPCQIIFSCLKLNKPDQKDVEIMEQVLQEYELKHNFKK